MKKKLEGSSRPKGINTHNVLHIQTLKATTTTTTHSVMLYLCRLRIYGSGILSLGFLLSPSLNSQVTIKLASWTVGERLRFWPYYY